jgi:hypothetical protein
MIKIKQRFHIEWELKAFQEIKSLLVRAWQDHQKLFELLCQKNNWIKGELKKNNVKLDIILYESEHCEGNKLIETIFEELICSEPTIQRIYIHNSTLPEDIIVRGWLREQIFEECKEFYQNIVAFMELFKDNELPMTSIPMRLFIVGQILKDLIKDYDHYRCIDAVKMKGVKESIEELRRQRVYESNEGKVYDYSPLVKFIYGKNRLIKEVFSEEDFNHDDNMIVDSVLCSFVKYSDTGKDLFFGADIDKAQYHYVIRYRDKEKELKNHLLPKYGNLVKKTAKNSIYNEVYENPKNRIDDAIIGLFEAVKGCDPNSPSLQAYLKKVTQTKPHRAFKEITTTLYRKERRQQEIKDHGEEQVKRFFNERVSKEDLEHSGGSLDAPLDDEDRQRDTPKDNLKDNPSLTLEDEVFLSEIYEKEPKLKAFIEKESEKPLSSTERSTKKRIIEKLKKEIPKKLTYL